MIVGNLLQAWTGTTECVPESDTACDDADSDGVCDDVDDCVGELDECGVCNGTGIADGACDCDGNVEDCAGTCGGSAVIDECGVCDGEGIADGACDCDGTLPDECGVCGGQGPLFDCFGELVCEEYDCNFDDICTDEAACNYGEEGNCGYYLDCDGICGSANWDCEEWTIDENLVASWNSESNINFENPDCIGEFEMKLQKLENHPHQFHLQTHQYNQDFQNLYYFLNSKRQLNFHQ
jgi:hypothetical protein